eukprot:jgi/Orpsp1_1/1176989/evm.model.c7180000059745.1
MENQIKKLKEFYGEKDLFNTTKAKKAIIYKSNDFGFTKEIHMLTLQYPDYQRGFFWISRIRCGFKFDHLISIKRNEVSENCSNCCPCYGGSVPSFSHWINSCPVFTNFRNKYLFFIDDMAVNFTLIIVQQKSLDVSLDSEWDYEDNIYYFKLSALLGGCSIHEKLKLENGEQRQFVDKIFQSSTEST